jgi:hypothetical protein
MSILQPLLHPMTTLAAAADLLRLLIQVVEGLAAVHPAVVPFSLLWHAHADSIRSARPDPATSHRD